MYDKRMLKELPVPLLPRDRSDEVFSNKDVLYIVRSALAINRNLLIAAFYDREAAGNGFSLPTAVLYITKKEYITRLNTDGVQTWSKASIRKALRIQGQHPYPNINGAYHADEDRIRKFLRPPKPGPFGVSSGIDHHIEAYQDMLLENRLHKRWADQKKEYDALMDAVPPLPAGFHKWLDNEPMKLGRFIFYQRINNKISKAYCSRCSTDFLLDNGTARHNKMGICPKCGDHIQYKVICRSTSLVHTANAVIAQKTKDGGLVLRYFWLDRDFSSHSYSPQINYRYHKEYVSERARLFLDKEGVITGAYKRGWVNFLEGYGFYKSKDIIFGENRDYSRSFMGYSGGESINIWFRPAYLYPYNLHGIFDYYSLPYSLRDDFKRRKPLDITTYLVQYVRYPIISTFDKLGLNTLAEDLFDGQDLKVYHGRGSLHNRLGITKEQLKMVAEHNFATYQINLITSSSIQPTLENLLWMSERNMNSRSVTTILRYTTMHKLQKYVMQQVGKQKNKKNNTLFSYDRRSPECIMADYWADYLTMSSTLEFKTKKWRILFPKDVKDQHDKVTALIKVKHDPRMDAKIKKMYPVLDEKYSYGNDKYFLRPVRDFNDFIEEGAELMHCVASSGFYKYHVQGSSYIFLIRKRREPNNAYYTMEFDPKKNEVKQLRGYKDCSPTKQIAAFRDEWLAAMGYLDVGEETEKEAA